MLYLKAVVEGKNVKEMRALVTRNENALEDSVERGSLTFGLASSFVPQ